MAKIRVILAVCLIIIFVICTVPVIIPLLVILSTPRLYVWLWARIRHDPECDATIHEIEPESAEGIDCTDTITATKQATYVTTAFELLSGTLATLSGAVQGELIRDGFSILREPHPSPGTVHLNLMQTLTTNHAVIILSYDYSVVIGRATLSVPYTIIREDDRGESFFLHIHASVKKSVLPVTYHFTTKRYEDVWAIVSILRGKA
jgi:hypothetical protein